jgi:hypothetical protein
VKPRWLALLGLAATVPLAPSDCATCRSDAPKVEPSVSGRGSGGSSGIDPHANARVDFEVSNLFCKSPKQKPDAK